MGAELATAIGMFILVFGAIFGVYRFLDGKMVAIRTEANTKAETASALASMTQSNLDAHRLHTAEHYVSKAGHRESTEQIMQALGSVKESIDGTNARIDRLYEASNGSTTRRRAAG